MNLITAYTTCFKKYASFKGRARRSEYWFFYLANLLITLPLTILVTIALLEDAEVLLGVAFLLVVLYSLVCFLPGLAVIVRRLHDTGRSGGYYGIAFIPLVGPILLLVWLCTDSDPGENRYGPSPKEQIENTSQTIPYADVTVDFPASSDNDFPFDPPPSRPGVSVSIQVPDPSSLPGKSVAAGETVYVGRDSQSCQLVFPNSTGGVSRRHCAVHYEQGRIMVCDVGSSYGTFLPNGTRLTPNQPVVVPSGTVLYLGSRSAAIRVEPEVPEY